MRRDASSLMLGITPLIWHGSVLTWQTKHKCLPPGLVKLLFHSHPAFPGAPVLVQRCSSTILRVLPPFLLTHCPVSSICRCHLVLRSLSAVPSLPTRSHSVLLTSRIRIETMLLFDYSSILPRPSSFCSVHVIILTKLRLMNAVPWINIRQSFSQCTDVVQDLGVLLDSEIRSSDTSARSPVCFYHLSRISHGTTLDVNRSSSFALTIATFRTCRAACMYTGNAAAGRPTKHGCCRVGIAREVGVQPPVHVDRRSYLSENRL